MPNTDSAMKRLVATLRAAARTGSRRASDRHAVDVPTPHDVAIAGSFECAVHRHVFDQGVTFQTFQPQFVERKLGTQAYSFAPEAFTPLGSIADHRPGRG